MNLTTRTARRLSAATAVTCAAILLPAVALAALRSAASARPPMSCSGS